ncbi:MAG: NAD-dependent dehydratase [Candidatus Schekmanbacteria bacterium RIFCSPHIGHO2_02_FULL_38_11]|nr:MAG: NAD-dependent dehydratase [Candidatus Schekmanbacteria bacterium RIFCSPHIGHO2_02_FULL_38_11]
MKVLITGGAGFLGSHLGDAFLAKGDEVFVLDQAKDFKIRHNLGNPKFHYFQDSILNEEILDSLVFKTDLIYHMAAVVGVEHYVGDPYNVLNVNINGTQNVLKAAFKYNKKIIFTSTSEIYGRNPKVPFSEDDDRVLGSTRIDRWCYSTSKAAGEHFCFAYYKMGLPVVILRYFNVYGPRLDKIDVGRILTIFMGQILRNELLSVIGDGMQTRCFTYIDDAIKATVAAGLLKEAEGKIFNVGDEKETTIKELAERMIKISGANTTIKYVTKESVYGDSYEDIQRRVPKVELMNNILKVHAETSLDDGLRTTIEWFRAIGKNF